MKSGSHSVCFIILHNKKERKKKKKMNQNLQPAISIPVTQLMIMATNILISPEAFTDQKRNIGLHFHLVHLIWPLTEVWTTEAQ